MSVVAASQGNVVIRKVHPHIGAEVLGLDLREPIDEPSFESVMDAFNEHSVLVFRNQNITDDQQVEFSRRFGELEKTSFAIAAPNPYIYGSSQNIGKGTQVWCPINDLECSGSLSPRRGERVRVRGRSHRHPHPVPLPEGEGTLRYFLQLSCEDPGDRRSAMSSIPELTR